MPFESIGVAPASDPCETVGMENLGSRIDRILGAGECLTAVEISLGLKNELTFGPCTISEGVAYGDKMTNSAGQRNDIAVGGRLPV
jgi:hypothetical protein